MKYGLHISTAGNLVGTPARAKGMGASVMQIFASNPRGWRPTIYSDEVATQFKAACQEADMPTFIHMIYLVSYGTADAELRAKSITAMAQTLATADQLGCVGVVTHLGSHKGLGLAQALDRLSSGLLESMSQSQDSLLILENSAGSGGNIGNGLDELAEIFSDMKHHPRLRVCLDTAHTLAAGYEIRTQEGFDAFIKEFDDKIGLDRLVVMHLNDSKVDIGAHVDRHQNIGDGHIGNDGFKVILNHPALAEVPGILEVPGLDNKGPDQANIERLQALTQ